MKLHNDFELYNYLRNGFQVQHEEHKQNAPENFYQSQQQHLTACANSGIILKFLTQLVKQQQINGKLMILVKLYLNMPVDDVEEHDVQLETTNRLV